MKISILDNTYTARRVFCIGKNYTAHIREMNDPTSENTVIFMKPSTCLHPLGECIPYPSYSNSFQHEVEVVVLIGKSGKNIPPSEALDHIAGISLGLDLTLRDIQLELKDKKQPWERSKAFDNSAPLGSFIPFQKDLDLDDIIFECKINNELRQKGNSGDMIYSIPVLIGEISKYWNLLPGDLIFTGTPSGISDLHPGDLIDISSEKIGSFSWKICK